MNCPELPQQGESQDAIETDDPGSKKRFIDVGAVLGGIIGADPEQIIAEEPVPPVD